MAAIDRIWKRYTSNVVLGVLDGFPGIQEKYDRADLASKISALPMDARQRVAITAKRIGVSKSLVQSLLDEGHLARRSARIKPMLSEEQSSRRVSHMLLFLDEKTCEFEPIYDFLHVDDKWFNEDVNGRLYLPVTAP
ncbi:hypothetical protein PHMEG_00022151 [Phytophthora megakarya]|uniref:Uncharacterized protein n=1 Tax=Phytophthora megakarya TaxID=4795 RepID=A0A225VK52_9STRA|nr:hypothetical protein PHMEG_00022151 [Phytophthora megakarya]